MKWPKKHFWIIVINVCAGVRHMTLRHRSEWHTKDETWRRRRRRLSSCSCLKYPGLRPAVSQWNCLNGRCCYTVTDSSVSGDSLLGLHVAAWRTQLRHQLLANTEPPHVRRRWSVRHCEVQTPNTLTLWLCEGEVQAWTARWDEVQLH